MTARSRLPHPSSPPTTPSWARKSRLPSMPLASRGLTSTDVEVDGGIHEQAIAMAIDAGATIAVAGSAVFDATWPVPACVTALRHAAARTATSRAAAARGA